MNRSKLILLAVSVVVAAVLTGLLVTPGCEDPAGPVELAQAWAAYEEGRPEVAHALAVQLADAGGTVPADLASLMELLIRTGEAPRAVAVYQSFEGPLGPVAGDSFILALLAMGRLDDGEAEILKRFKAGTMTARTQQMRGRLAMARGKADEARRALLEAQRQDENDPETWALLGRVLLVLRQVPRAEGLLLEALRRFPESLEVRKTLAELVAAKQTSNEESFELLVELLTPVSERRPQDLRARRDLGIALRRLGRFRQSERIFRDLTKESRVQASDWQNLGVALAEQEDWEEAVTSFERSAEMDSWREELCLNLGNALLRQAQLDMKPIPLIVKARDVYEHALTLNPKSARAMVGLGRSAVKMNPTEDPQALAAIKYFEDAIAIDPQLFEAHLQLALLYYDVWMPGEKVRGDGYWRAKREFEAAAALRSPNTWTRGARQAFEALKE